MKILLRSFPILLVLVGVAMICERPAYAYADPGTGLLAVQAVGSVLVATGWYLRRKISALLHWGSASKAARSDRQATEAGEGASPR
jgi:hypothetical protein